jgi:hypothetical protein
MRERWRERANERERERVNEREREWENASWLAFIRITQKMLGPTPPTKEEGPSSRTICA